ncbi:MAG TPA: tetratricopeptide repeat protein, partial [Tahibacter sp.]|nr:tetratricopeptide repeat protein [Tahibacter sp.]
RTPAAFGAIVAIVLLLPAAAIGLYVALGNPAAMDPAAAAPAANGDHGPDMDQAVAGLAAKLKQNPDDAEGWLLLGRAYKSMQRFDDARDAVKEAYQRMPDNPDVQVDYAEALALASADRKLDGEPRELLQKAVKSNPQHQRGLWLLGVADRQAERYADAVAHWETLLAQMPAGSDAANSVQAQIDEARSAGKLPAGQATAGQAASGQATAAAKPEAAAPAADGDIRLTVTVALDAKLRTQAPADATVFVFARAASGPPMPLAVQRVKVSDLPTTVTLTEGMGMLPNLKLSQFPQVVIGARVSQSGNAIAQPGDLQTLSAAVDVKRREPVEVTIDKVVQ